MHYKLDNVQNYFKLPIEYNDKKMLVSENIKNDLELHNAKDNNSIYNSLFINNNKYAINTVDLWSNYYTYDKSFIKDTQKLLKSDISYNIQNLQCWDQIKGENEFNDKYSYINNHYLKFLNNSSLFLQILCLYKFISPIFALLYPIFVAIVPYFFLKLSPLKISLSQYLAFVKIYIMNSSIVKLFTTFSIHNWRNTVYLLFSVIMYFVSLYQNIISCIHFHYNMKNINGYILELTEYIKNGIKNMNNFSTTCHNLKTYKPFLNNMTQHKRILFERLKTFENITNYSWNFHNLSHMGYSMKVLYHIYYDTDFHNAMMYSFGFNGFILNLNDIQSNIKSSHINLVKFSKTTKFKEAYYPIFKNKKHVKNNYSISNNLIISGPNASGKTTLIKTTLFNILISQQIGCGFYKSGNIRNYKYIHSYLNIPDTSDRDSLFQAEARRCREIISTLKHDEKEYHFCIFDELYSGTNPYEANASAYAFIKYLLKHKIDFMLTTHFVELCNNLEETKHIKNTQMEIINNNDDIKYLYKLVNGISKHRGGVKVLKQLDYPVEIINETIKYLNKNHSI